MVWDKKDDKMKGKGNGTWKGSFQLEHHVKEEPK